MIRINLLPAEYRRRKGKPVKLMIAGSLALAGATSLLAWWGWLTLGVATEVAVERGSLETEMACLTPQIDYHNTLRQEAAFHASREATLAQITAGRVLWTQVLDELTDVVNRGHAGARHTIWFDDILAVVEDATGSAQGSHGRLEAKGHSGSAEIDQISHFLADLTDPELSTLPEIFGTPSAPEGKRNQGDSELVPNVDFSFPLRLKLLDPQERKQSQPGSPDEGEPQPDGEDEAQAQAVEVQP